MGVASPGHSDFAAFGSGMPSSLAVASRLSGSPTRTIRRVSPRTATVGGWFFCSSSVTPRPPVSIIFIRPSTM